MTFQSHKENIMSEIQKFDPSQLMQGVRDRIKATFVSLIPDEQWEQMIKKEADGFFAKKENYSNRDYISDFQQECRKVMNDVAKEKVILFMKTYDHQLWNGNIDMPEPTDALKQLLLKMAPELFVGMMSNMIQKTISEISRRNY